jgi:lipopolysaccharide transport system ATP-binding protein
VSHNMATIQTLCRRALVLERGRIVGDLPAVDAVKLYLKETAGGESFVRAPQAGGRPTIVAAKLESADDQIEVTVQVRSAHAQRAALDLRLKDGLGTPVGLGSLGSMSPMAMIRLQSPLTEIRFRFSTSTLATGSYLVSLDLTIPGAEYLDRVEDCASFELRRSPRNGALHALPQDWGYGALEIELTGLDIRTYDAGALVGVRP